MNLIEAQTPVNSRTQHKTILARFMYRPSKYGDGSPNPDVWIPYKGSPGLIRRRLYWINAYIFLQGDGKWWKLEEADEHSMKTIKKERKRKQ